MTDPTSEPRVIFYWRPGCGFCTMLRRSLSGAGVALDERNIWEDEAARAEVQRINDGNETVPTVVVGDVELTNPRPEDVLAAIAG